jgi:hypothetical protein
MSTGQEIQTSSSMLAGTWRYFGFYFGSFISRYAY